jgi:hypothetical protein
MTVALELTLVHQIVAIMADILEHDFLQFSDILQPFAVRQVRKRRNARMSFSELSPSAYDIRPNCSAEHPSGVTLFEYLYRSINNINYNGVHYARLPEDLWEEYHELMVHQNPGSNPGPHATYIPGMLMHASGGARFMSNDVPASDARASCGHCRRDRLACSQFVDDEGMLAHFGACINCYIQSRLQQCSFCKLYDGSYGTLR